MRRRETRKQECHVHMHFSAVISKPLRPQQNQRSEAKGVDQVPQDPVQNLQLHPDDWQVPLVVPIDKMGEGMYTTPNSHKPKGIDLQDFQKGVARAAVPWKPAGPAAMQRMAAASYYLMAEAQTAWAHADYAWAGALLARFGVYRDKRDGSYFVSLGVVSWVAMVLPLVCEDIGGIVHLHFLEQAKVRPVANHSVTDASCFEGVPVESIAPWQCPPQLVNVGIVWRQICALMPLVPYAVLCRCSLDVASLRGICRAHHISVVRLPGSKSLTKDAYIIAVVRHFFPEEPWETQSEMVHGLISGDRGLSHTDDSLCKVVVECMDKQEQEQFKDLFTDKQYGTDEVEENKPDLTEIDMTDLLTGPKHQRGKGRGRGRGRRCGRGRGRGKAAPAPPDQSAAPADGQSPGRGRGRGRSGRKAAARAAPSVEEPVAEQAAARAAASAGPGGAGIAEPVEEPTPHPPEGGGQSQKMFPLAQRRLLVSQRHVLSQRHLLSQRKQRHRLLSLRLCRLSMAIRKTSLLKASSI